MNVREFLKDKQIEWEVIPHRPTYDAQRMAQAVDVPGREVAKTVLLRVDGGERFAVAVLPATGSVDVEKASGALGGALAELATEEELGQQCPDCELGALPPFGSRYGMTTLVDETLAEDEEIVFEGNTHTEAIRMRFDDFRRIEEPTIASFRYGPL